MSKRDEDIELLFRIGQLAEHGEPLRFWRERQREAGVDERRTEADLLLFHTWWQTHWFGDTDPMLQKRARELRKLLLQTNDPLLNLIADVLADNERPSKDREGQALVYSIQATLENEEWEREFERQRAAGGLEAGIVDTMAHSLVMRLTFFSPEAKKQLPQLPEMTSSTRDSDLGKARALVARKLAPMLRQYERDPKKLAVATLRALGATHKQAHNILRE